MNKQEIASLAVKLLSLSVIVNTVITLARTQAPYIQQQLYNATQGIQPQFGFSDFAWGEILPWIFPLIVAFLLWKFSDWLGGKMVANTEDKKTKTSLSPLEIQSIVLSAIGLFILLNTLPEFIMFLVYVASPSISGSDFSTVMLSLINPLLSILLGAFLTFRGSQLAGYLQNKK